MSMLVSLGLRRESGRRSDLLGSANGSNDTFGASTLQNFRQRQNVIVRIPLIIDAIDISPDQVDPETTDLPVAKSAIQVRLRGLKRVEGNTVVPYRDFHRIVIPGTGDADIVLDVIIKTVVDDIGKKFIQRKIDLKLRFFGDTAAFAKRCHMLAEHVQIGQPVLEIKRDLGHVDTTIVEVGACRF
jgi:hypothetical protein